MKWKQGACMSEDYLKDTQPQTNTESAPPVYGGQQQVGAETEPPACSEPSVYSQRPTGEENVQPQSIGQQSGAETAAPVYSPSQPSQPGAESAEPVYSPSQSGAETAAPVYSLPQPPQPGVVNAPPVYQPPQMYVQNPQENPYMQQNYGSVQPPRQKGNGIGFGIASLALGIASVFLFGCCVNYITAVLAVIFGVLQMVKNRQKGMAVAGIVTACVSILLGTLMWIGIARSMDGRSIDEIYDEIYEGGYDFPRIR